MTRNFILVPVLGLLMLAACDKPAPGPAPQPAPSPAPPQPGPVVDNSLK